jgi:phosphoribosylamine--glycine ligase
MLTLMLAIARGDPMPDATATASASCVTTVLAAANYPEAPRTGDPITIPPDTNAIVFHAGTAMRDGKLVTSGGRVLAVSAVASTIGDAQRLSSAAADEIDFAGKQRRTDIGWREIARASRN